MVSRVWDVLNSNFFFCAKKYFFTRYSNPKSTDSLNGKYKSIFIPKGSGKILDKITRYMKSIFEIVSNSSDDEIKRSERLSSRTHET